MQLFGPSGVRAFPIDRNPTTVFAGAPVTTVTGGATTNLNSYTVPAGRRAILQCHISGVPSVALAAGQTAELTVFVDPQLGVEAGYARGVWAGTAAINAERSVNADLPVAVAGDSVRLNVNVAAGAGTIIAAGGIHGVEFDT